MSEYGLSAILDGHKLDVRCITSFHSNSDNPSAIISGSRDNTARLWVSTTPKSKNDQPEWSSKTIFKGHTRYVSSVAFRQPDEKYIHGLVYTGCLDGLIRAYEPDVPEPNHTLEGHTGAVSSIFVSGNKTTLTSSWDKTAKVWLNEKCMTTLKGHEGAVWCGVILPNVGIMVTGSADSTLKLWKGGQCLKTISGIHTQAVRDLEVISSNSIVSCGNDGQILLWKINISETEISTQIIQKFDDSDYVYSLSTFKGIINPGCWVSSGENTGIKLFDETGKLSQAINVPAQSVWCVTALNNGDIAAACSNHKIYVFTKDSSRMSSEEQLTFFGSELEDFQKSVANLDNGSGSYGLPDEVGGVKVSDMPIGPDALTVPGKRDGQTKMVKWPKENKITAHSWSEQDQKWTLLGDVVANDNNIRAKSAKLDGKEYDYVFDIDIGDGIPALKLPYNNDQEPYRVAQDFINRNELPQGYLDEVAKFIINNSNFAPLTAKGNSSDPFTGSGAYVSGSGGIDSPSLTRGIADPFTGSSAYSTRAIENQRIDSSEYFPQKTYLTFTQVPAMEKLTTKLKALNDNLPQQEQIREEEMSKLVSLSRESPVSRTDIALFFKVLRWPQHLETQTFNPVLDVARLAFINVSDGSLAQTLLSNPDLATELTDILMNFIKSNNTINQMLAIKTATNMFSCKEGVEVICQHKAKYLENISEVIPTENKNCQIAVATLILNYAVASTLSKIDPDLQTQCITICSLLIVGLTDPEAKYRTLIALGTLLQASPSNVSTAKMIETKESVVSAMMIVEQGHKIHRLAEQIQRYI